MGLIAERLVERRKSKGLKQTELADTVKISIPTITRMENGKSNPKAEELSNLAAALDTSVAYLLGETNDPKRYKSMLDDDRFPASGNQPMHEIFKAARENTQAITAEDVRALGEILKDMRSTSIPLKDEEVDSAVKLVQDDRFIRNIVLMMGEMSSVDLAEAARFVADKKELSELRKKQGA